MHNIILSKRVLILILSAVSLTACFDSDNKVKTPVVVVTPPPAPPPPQSIESNFGTGFEQAFGQSAFDEAIDPIASDIIAIDKTVDPIDVPNPD